MKFPALSVPEKTIQNMIEAELKYNGYEVIRLNSGKAPVTAANGQKRYIRLADKGTADLVALRSGKTYFIEVKTQTGRQTIEQKAFQQRIEKQGFPYVLARSNEDVWAVLPKRKPGEILEAYFKGGAL